MIVKRIVLGVVLLLGVGIGAKAYVFSRLTNKEKAEHITEKMSVKLDLTESQKNKVYQINLDRVNGHLRVYEEGRDRQALEKEVLLWENRLKDILTDDQCEKLGL